MPLIDALPEAPSTSDPTNFATEADAWVAALATWTTQANALANLLMAATTSASTTSLAIGTGSKSLTVGTGLGYAVGQTINVASAANPLNRMVGIITAYTSGTGALVFTSQFAGGSGTHADWVVSLSVPTTEETGTATLTLAFATPGSSSFGSITQTANWRADGNRCRLDFTLAFTPTIGTGSGVLLIGGLPKTPANTLAAGSLKAINSRFSMPGGFSQYLLVVHQTSPAALALHVAGTAASSGGIGAGNMTDGQAHTLGGTIDYEYA